MPTVIRMPLQDREPAIQLLQQHHARQFMRQRDLSRTTKRAGPSPVSSPPIHPPVPPRTADPACRARGDTRENWRSLPKPAACRANPAAPARAASGPPLFSTCLSNAASDASSIASHAAYRDRRFRYSAVSAWIAGLRVLPIHAMRSFTALRTLPRPLRSGAPA